MVNSSITLNSEVETKAAVSYPYSTRKAWKADPSNEKLKCKSYRIIRYKRALSLNVNRQGKYQRPEPY